MVSSTGSGQVYNFHKATLKESDILNLSNDINDFGNRYRVFAGEPSSNNDEGDLVYDTNANKMKVYDTSTSAWKEVTSSGDFKYIFLCPAGGSGAPTINGSIATYDLREGSNTGSAASVTSAAQLIVSINGVIQKANTGTSAPSEGFALVDSNTIVFGANLQTGDSVFIVQIGSAITISTPGDGTVSAAKIASGAVETAKIADDAVDATKLANSINAEIAANTAKTTNQTHTGDVTGSVALTIANDAVTTAKISNDAVTTSKIADAELKTLAGMQSGTASKLADSTALTADIADLNQIDGMAKQTTITDDDTKFPTSGAIVDYVTAQLEPFGGFEAIADDQSFPNTQPASGVAISIADAAGIVVTGSNSSTTGRTLNGTTVTINNISSQFTSSTIASGVRFIVTSTGSGHVYNYHKATLPESDLANLSGDINDFNERYRVGSSNPTSSLDGGDLFLILLRVNFLYIMEVLQRGKRPNQ